MCTSNTAMITFDAHGTPSSSNLQHVDITGGTFQITSIHDGQTLYSGNIYGGRYVNTSGGGNVRMSAQANDVTNNTSSCISSGDDISIITPCSTSDTNSIHVYAYSQYELASFEGAVECFSRDTQSSSSSMTEVHKMEMVTEYLMLMITVRIFLIQDVIKKEIQQ